MPSNTEIVAAHYRAADAHDLPGMIAPFAEDVAWTEAAGFPTAGTYVGADAIVENVFGALLAEWNDWVVHIDELITEGDTVIAIGSYTAINKATGRSMRARTTHVWRLAEGKVRSFEQIADSAMVRAAMPELS